MILADRFSWFIVISALGAYSSSVHPTVNVSEDSADNPEFIDTEQTTVYEILFSRSILLADISISNCSFVSKILEYTSSPLLTYFITPVLSTVS